MQRNCERERTLDDDEEVLTLDDPEIRTQSHFAHPHYKKE